MVGLSWRLPSIACVILKLAGEIATEQNMHTPLKTPTQSSYSMKHVAERAIWQYVANGELIAATLMAGYPMSRPHGPNAPFGMSPRDVNRVRAASKAQETAR